MLHALEAVRGGTSRHLVDLVTVVEGVEHHVALPPASNAGARSGADYDHAAVVALERAGAQIHRVDMRRTPPQPANVMAALRLRSLLGYLDVDVAHGHSAVAGALLRVAAAGTGRPVAYTPHGVATGVAALAVERALGPRTDRFVAVSDSEAELARRRHLAPPGRVVVIRNGVDLTDRPPPAGIRAQLGIGPDVPLVGTVSRLAPQKAPERFVGVCARVARARPDAHFLIVGHGPLQPDVDRAVAHAGLTRVWHQIDQLPNAAAAIGELDAFVLTSRFEAGCTYASMEAMRAGTPVVVSDVVGNRDTVEDGVSGFMAPFGDDDAMASAVLAMVNDPAHRAEIVAAARTRLERYFDVRGMGLALAELYSDLAGSADRRRTRRLPHARPG